MNEVDQKLHTDIHRRMMEVSPDKIFSPRVDVFDFLEKKLDLVVSGSVLDIGCGSGYAAIWLAKNRSVDKVYALEASLAAVNELIPRNIKHHGVGEIVEPVLGTFDAVPTNNLDFVVSFGALHHSSCLLSTMRSISDSLTEGGYLIAQEPVMPNMTTNQAYIDKYEVVEERFGEKIRNGDRQDCFFREAEYVVAAAFSGLDMVFYDNYAQILTRSQWKRGLIAWLRGRGRDLYRRFIGNTKLQTDTLPLAKHTKNVVPKIMVLRKATPSYIPHLWSALK
jgi:SAM-dependent methyltransferase